MSRKAPFDKEIARGLLAVIGKAGYSLGEAGEGEMTRLLALVDQVSEDESPGAEPPPAAAEPPPRAEPPAPPQWAREPGQLPAVPEPNPWSLALAGAEEPRRQLTHWLEIQLTAARGARD